VRMDSHDRPPHSIELALNIASYRCYNAATSVAESSAKARVRCRTIKR
jgi:hypothetical protein